MKVVVITGSSRGIGFGLAEAFLARGCSVVISGSSEESTRAAIEQLTSRVQTDHIQGTVCDVRDYQQVKTLWTSAITRFGKVDIWINNAGLSGPVLELRDQSPKDYRTVLDTNLLGVIHGSQVALKGMLDQGFGAIYSMEGMGSDGRMHEGMTIYGMTKYGLKYFNDALAKETRSTPVIVGALRPGMVVTDLIVDQYKDRPDDWNQVKGIFNLIADRVEKVTPWLVDQILANKKNGARINYTSTWVLLWRMLTKPFTRRDIFSGTGL
jgi:NAD(P)-dependent dehydrogenase (short-subunit alcohol dehydrogenase family)